MIKLCFVDCETTGLDSNANGLIQLSGEIGYWNDENYHYDQRDVFDYFIRPFPGDVIEPAPLKVNKLTVEEIQGFTPPLTVYEEFKDILENHINRYSKTDKFFFIGYNAGFDWRFCWDWFKKCGNTYFGAYFHYPYLDIMEMAAIDLISVRHSLKNFKLGTIAEYYGIMEPGEADKLHDSAFDIATTKKIFFHLLKKQRGIK